MLCQQIAYRASRPSIDGKGVFQYVLCPGGFEGKPKLKPVPPYIHSTPPQDLGRNHTLTSSTVA